MTRIFFTFSFLFLILGVCSCQTDSSQIKDCFSEYKSATINHDGKKAVGLVDIATLDSYYQLLDKVKNWDSTKLEKEPPSLKFEVLKIRHIISSADILEMDGEKLLMALIDRGISGNGTLHRSTLGEITIHNDSAMAGRISNGEVTPFRYLFFKEENSWKIHMPVPRTLADIAIKQMATDSKMTENEYIFKLLETSSGIKPSEQIWKPVR